MADLLPLGSIVSKNNIKYCILGYANIEKASKQILGYTVAPYPFGFLDKSLLGILDCEDVEEVIFVGYETEKSEAVCELYSNVHSAMCKYGSDVVAESMQTVKTVLEKKSEEAENND